MNKEKEKLIKKRLILVKVLYEHGKKHAYNGTYLDRIIAIHNLDNSIEWLLKCIALNSGIEIDKKKYSEFYELWNAISEKNELPYKEDIFALHTLRNQVQHHANTPSTEDVDRFVSCIGDFIVRTLKGIFTIDYDELYLSSLIENEDLKVKIIESEKAFENKEYLDSINLCMNALTDAAWRGKITIALLAGRLTDLFGAQEEFKNLINEEYITKIYPHNRLAREVGRALLQLGQSSTCMQFLTLPQKMTFLKMIDVSDKMKVSKKDAQESISFVIDVILNWEEIGLIQLLRPKALKKP